MRGASVTLLFVIITFNLSGQGSVHNLLSDTYSKERLSEIIVPKNQWNPFPTYSNHRFWEQIPDSLQSAYINRAETLLDYDWPALPATMFMEYVRMGDRRHFESYHFERRNNLRILVFAELIEHKGRFLDQIINGIWAICEETYWGVPAHLGMQQAGRGLPDVREPIVDLFAAQTGQLLAWTDYLLRKPLDEVNPLISDRIHYEVKRKILDVLMYRNDFYWMGFDLSSRGGRRVNNWNPWINANWLACNLLIEDDPEKRIAATHKIMRSLDNFLNPHPFDGGCDEGPSYWNHAGGSLFDALELLNLASNGEINIYDHQLIRNIGTYIYKAYIDYPYFVNFADASPTINYNGPQVFRYGNRIDDKVMMGFGAFGARKLSLEELMEDRNISRHLFMFNNYDEIFQHSAQEPLIRDAWLPDTEVMIAREKAGTNSGLYLAAKGGHNDESHNHNDIGNFIIYVDGNPVLIDAGKGTYTSKTFGEQRYTLWNNNSNYHNLPSINGKVQLDGPEFKATDVRYKMSDKKVNFVLDITEAYKAERLKQWQRSLVFNRSRGVTLTDEYEFTEIPDINQEHFLTICKVEQNGGILQFHDPQSDNIVLQLEYNDERLSLDIEKLELNQPEDKRIIQSWGNEIYRVTLTDTKPGKKGKYAFTISK